MDASDYARRLPRTDEEWESLWASYDVRPVLAELRAAGEFDLDRVEWGRFHHWYGAADDVPGLLRALAGPDPEKAGNVRWTLWETVVHQGGTSGPAALAVPFLLRIAADPAVCHRSSALALAAWAGHRVNFVVETRSTLFQVGYPLGEIRIGASGERSDWALQAAREALGADAAILIDLVDDDDPDVRITAAFAVATALNLPPEADGVLRDRLAVEPEAAVRVSLVLAIEQLGADPSEAELWWRDPARPDDVRFAAAIAWLCLTDLPVPADLTNLLAELATPEMEQTIQRVPWPNYHFYDGLEGWLTGLIAGTPF